MTLAKEINGSEGQCRIRTSYGFPVQVGTVFLLPSTGSGLKNPNCLLSLKFVVKSLVAANSIAFRLSVSGDDV